MSQAVKMLYQVNTVWKQDLMLYIRCMSGERRQTASEIMKTMISSGMAEEFAPYDPSKIAGRKMSQEGSYADPMVSQAYRKLQDNERSTGYSLIRITEKGAVYLDEHCRDVSKGYFGQNLSRFAKRFSSVRQETMIRELNQSKVLCMMAAGHAAVLNWEKPAPITLFDCFAEPGNAYIDHLRSKGTSSFRMSDTMAFRMERSAIMNLLGKSGGGQYHGIYYQLSDIRELLKQLGTGAGDRFNGSVCYGAVVNDCGIYCIFSEAPGNERFVRVNVTFEEALRQSLYQLFGKIPMLFSQEAVSSVLICNGTARIPAVMTGLRNARVRRIYDPKGEKYSLPDEDIRLAPASSLITYNTSLPGRIFPVPYNSDGAELLRNCLSMNEQDAAGESRKMIADNPEYFVPNPLGARMNEYVFGSERRIDGYPVIYLPVPEIGMLHVISTQFRDGCALIILHPGIAEALSRALRIPARYYCREKGSDHVVQLPGVMRYTRYGYLVQADGSYNMPEPVSRSRHDHSGYQPRDQPYGKKKAGDEVRLFIRITASQRDLYLSAADLLGVSLRKWAVAVLDSSARKVLEDHRDAVSMAQSRKNH